MNFSSLFLSIKRLREILDEKYFYAAGNFNVIANVPTHAQNHIRIINDLEHGIVQWLRASPLPTLGELIITGKLDNGNFFTHYGPCFGKGTTVAATKYQQDKPINTPARLLVKLGDLHDGATLTCQLHPENYTSCSSATELSGQKRLFSIGRITSCDLPSLEAQAYAIGWLHKQERSHGGIFAGDFLPNHMEVYVGSIDCFKKVQDVSHISDKEMKQLESIPEANIKTAFAEIIGETFVPKDWGGEFSDLQTSRLAIDGKSYASAFIFKGPSKFKPMTVSDLGKNGDQIYRLFCEPVDFVVVQHCHKITSPVRAHMRAFATRVGLQRSFCLIDGADTVRILKAYRKCGYTG